MMSLRRIFGLILLFIFFETAVAVAAAFLAPGNILIACFVMTGLAVLVWAVFVILSRILSRQSAPKETPRSFVPAAQKSSPEDSFILELKASVDEADRRLAGLTAHKDKGIVQSVRTLPLYLVIGPEGSGKTTAIINSGLEPKLLSGEALKDGQVIPTGAANIWYAEGAIFLEIGGYIFLQEPDRWEKALRVLAAQRTLPTWQRLLGRRTALSNLRGVILTCDASMFQARDARLAGTRARTVNERLQTIQKVMREDFPTYVLLTRSDGVRYFEEFFSHIGEGESRRALGVTLPEAKDGNDLANSYADQETSRLTKRLNRLYQSLADKRLLFLARDEVSDSRALAYEFPREFKKLRGDLVQFLLDGFRPATLNAPCRLRGVYFTGRRYISRDKVAPSDGTSVDYSMVRRSDATVFFNSPEKSSSQDYSFAGNSTSSTKATEQIFLTDLFRKIVLDDPAGRTVTALRSQAGDAKYLNLGLAACGTVLLVLSALWGFAWGKNHNLLAEVQAAIESTSNEAASQPVAVQFNQLEKLRPTMVMLHTYNRKGPPIGYRWGLYQGDNVMGDLDALYYTRFRQAALDPMLGGMNQAFLALHADRPVNTDIYKELKVYRILTSGKCKLDEALVTSAILQNRISTLSDVDAGESLDKQARFYASELKYGDPYRGSIPENAEAVESAQAYLRNLTGPDQMMQILLNQVRDKPAERLSGYASNYSQVLTGPDQVDGPYTRAGWIAISESIRNHKLAPSGEACVVGENQNEATIPGSAEMDNQVKKLYSDAYTQAWKQYLQSHHLVPFGNTTDAAQKLRTLADNNRSPLLALVYMTSTNTNVAPMRDLGDEAKESVVSAANTAATAIGNVAKKLGVDHKSDAPLLGGQTPAVPTVESAFDPVHTMVDPGNPNKWLNEKNQPYMKALADLSDALQTLPQEVHNDVPVETQEFQTAKTAWAAADSALHSLEANFPNTSSGIDIDLKNLLHEPISNASRTIASVIFVKSSPQGGTIAGGPTPAPPVDMTKIKASIKQVNVQAASLCSIISELQGKFPFDATSTTDASLEQLNGLLQPGTGAYSQFANNPDVTRTFLHTGRVWALKPDFPANYSQGFVNTLNNIEAMEQEMYGQGNANPHLDLTLSVDGTGKLPFELDVDSHVIKFTPGKPSAPVRLVWPPLTPTPTRLVLKTTSKKGGELPAQFPGPWGLFHLLQAADEESGNVFTFRSVHFANSLMPLTDDKGGPATVQIRVDSTSNLFSKGYFAKLSCHDTWALQSSGN
jgi:type VI secretion system protein ImpL